MAIPLEDSFSDILNKAMSGLRIDSSRFASLLAGKWDEALAAEACRVCGLSLSALKDIASGVWKPLNRPLPEGVAVCTTPFGDMTVNAFLVWDPVSRNAAAFDTGGDCSPILEILRARSLKLTYLFLTHTHGDHVFEFDRLVEKTGARAFAPAREGFDGALPLESDRTHTVGALEIEPFETPGHSPGGTSYLVHGFAVPVMIVGDALFAGSAGGAANAYREALKNVREQILTRSDETILCPGHGPLTTVGEEKLHNPFFAAGSI